MQPLIRSVLRTASLRIFGLLPNPRGAFAIVNSAVVKFLQKFPDSDCQRNLTVSSLIHLSIEFIVKIG